MIRKLTLLFGCFALVATSLAWSAVVHAASSNQFAVVSAAGNLRAGNGVASATRLGPGRYEVTFTTDVSGCAYLATTVQTHSEAVQAYTAGGHLGPNGVYVETKNQGGGLTDSRFSLAVICGGTGTGYAVVGYTANLVRSSGASLTFHGAGRYTVTFGHDVSGCAFLATVADPGNGLVFNPSGVYTASGAAAGSVYLETKNPGGGLQDGVPFHLGVVCPTAPDTRVAVAAANGLANRGSALTSTFQQRTGQYQVVTDVVVTDCAAIATRGSTDTGAPFNPATVEVKGGGVAPNTAGIEVRSLLFFGGAFADEAFHAALIC